MIKCSGYLGVYDWGIGGLGFYKKFKDQYPDVPVMYFSDAGYTPYGKVEPGKLEQRVNQVMNWMYENGAAYIVVACNAASTVFNPEEDNDRYTHIIHHAIRLVRKKNLGSVAVLGGERTIHSKIYERSLKGIQVNGVVAQPLSAMIEAGKIGSQEVADYIRELSEQIEEQSVLLACTHYPAAQKVFNEVFGDGVQILDPVEEAVEAMNPISIGLKNEGEDIWYTREQQVR